MPSRRVIKGILGNFIGTYSSRYSDYTGFWLFGFLVRDLAELQIDLLAPKCTESDSPRGVAIRTALAKFEDQLRKAGLAKSDLRQASLKLKKLDVPVEGSVNGHLCSGFNLSFSCNVLTKGGKHYEREQTVFAAPHDAKIEIQSARDSSRDKKVE